MTAQERHSCQTGATQRQCRCQRDAAQGRHSATQGQQRCQTTAMRRQCRCQRVAAQGQHGRNAGTTQVPDRGNTETMQVPHRVSADGTWTTQGQHRNTTGAAQEPPRFGKRFAFLENGSNRGATQCHHRSNPWAARFNTGAPQGQFRGNTRATLGQPSGDIKAKQGEHKDIQGSTEPVQGQRGRIIEPPQHQHRGNTETAFNQN